MESQKRIKKIINEVSIDKTWSGSLNYYELQELNQRDYLCMALEGGKYRVEKMKYEVRDKNFDSDIDYFDNLQEARKEAYNRKLQVWINGRMVSDHE